jgi:hypothetical protein
MRQRFSILSGYFLLVLFVSYYGNISLFIHTHEVNGERIVHSHFNFLAQDGNKTDHQHGTSSLHLIQALSHFYFTGLFLCAAYAALSKQISGYIRPKQEHFALKRVLIRANGWRAPPIQLHT